MRAVILGLCVLAASATTALAAQEKCAQRADVQRVLSGQYGEKPVAIGIADGGLLLEVWTHPDGRTWTLTLARPDGLTCLLLAGRNLVIEPPGEPS